MNTEFKVLLTAAFFAAIPTPYALAAAWTPTDTQDPEAPRVIFAETDTGVALLACSEGKLKAQLSNVSGDFAARMKKSAKYSRGVDVVLTVGEKVNKTARWKLFPAVDTVFTDNHFQAAQLYNAAVGGDMVSVTIDGEAYTELSLPGVDDTFTAFAKTCSFT